MTSSAARLALASPGHDPSPSRPVRHLAPHVPASEAPEVALPAAAGIDVIYEEQFDFVWRMARRLGVPESAADDVVQDTFVVLHRRLAEYDGETPIRRWLVGILTRVVSDHRRRYRRKDAACVPHPEESERALASSAPAPSAEAEHDSEVKAAKKKPTVSCPTFPPPAPSFCAGGKIVQVNGANGCFSPSCVMPPPPPTCPQVAAPGPGFCPGGTVTPRYNASTGCHVGFDCTPAPNNACTAAGGACVGLAPSSCAAGHWGSAATHSCGGGIGVGCCLP